MPYGRLSEDVLSVSGMPLGLDVRRPESYGNSQLKAILEAESSITFTWVDEVSDVSNVTISPSVSLPPSRKYPGGVRLLFPKTIIVADPKLFENSDEFLERDFWLFQITIKNREVQPFLSGVWLSYDNNVFKIWSSLCKVANCKFLKEESTDHIFQLHPKLHGRFENDNFVLNPRGQVVIERLMKLWVAKRRL